MMKKREEKDEENQRRRIMIIKILRTGKKRWTRIYRERGIRREDQK